MVDAAEAGLVGELRMQHVMHAQRDVGVLGGIGCGAFDIDLVEADLLGTLAAQVFIGNGVEAKVAAAQLAEVVALVGFDDVALQHGVVGDANQRNAMVGEDVLVVLGVLQHLFVRRLTQAKASAGPAPRSRGNWSATPGAVWASGM